MRKKGKGWKLLPDRKTISHSKYWKFNKNNSQYVWDDIYERIKKDDSDFVYDYIEEEWYPKEYVDLQNEEVDKVVEKVIENEEKEEVEIAKKAYKKDKRMLVKKNLPKNASIEKKFQIPFVVEDIQEAIRMCWDKCDAKFTIEIVKWDIRTATCEITTPPQRTSINERIHHQFKQWVWNHWLVGFEKDNSNRKLVAMKKYTYKNKHAEPPEKYDTYFMRPPKEK